MSDLILGQITDAIRKNGLPKATNGAYIVPALDSRAYGGDTGSTGSTLWRRNKNELKSACALGQAGINLSVSPVTIHSRLGRISVPLSVRKDAEIKLGFHISPASDLGYLITQLNDHTEMTLSEIADWVDANFDREYVLQPA